MLAAVLVAVALLGATALAAAAAGRSDRAAVLVGVTGSVVASVTGLAGAVGALLGGVTASARVAWSLPVGAFHVGLDALSAFFLLCVFAVSGLCALYGAGYLQVYRGKRPVAPAVALYNLLTAAMVLVALARDGVLFLVAWEGMSLASFFLVAYEAERAEARRAGMVYLTASQLGVVPLFVLFASLAHASGTYDFEAFRQVPVASATAEGWWLLVALAGFGTKAGFWPLHVWLPEAHPAAPSHVSALMSGVMIKMGIYGLLRTLAFLGSPPPWWGGTLVAVGAASAVAGVLQALAQHDLKRLLAYHSVENIGIIAIGIGLGLLGQAFANPTVAFLGYAGALLHVLNHALFKSLLFQGAGSVLYGSGTRDLDRLGGLYRLMPTTATTFLVGSLAICGLPPLNGFASEWLIYTGAFVGAWALPGAWAAVVFVAVPVLGLVGGLAAACFVKAFGVVFLGEARARAAAGAREGGMAMKGPMVTGALLCMAIGLGPAAALGLVGPVVTVLDPTAAAPAPDSLLAISRAAAVLLAFVALVATVRLGLLRGRPIVRGRTWACGYAVPGPRTQYTAGSFAAPLVKPLAGLLHARVLRHGPAGFFPLSARYDERLGDKAGERFLVPAIRRAAGVLARVRVIQQGRLQLYLLYVAGTVVGLLLWQLAAGGR